MSLIQESSAEHKGMHGTGITSFAYMPLSVANPKEASSLIANAETMIANQKTSGNWPAGLAEQYDLQIATLKDNTIPDFQFLVFPGGSITASTLVVPQ